MPRRVRRGHATPEVGDDPSLMHRCKGRAEFGTIGEVALELFGDRLEAGRDETVNSRRH